MAWSNEKSITMKRDKKKGRKDTENATMQAVCSIRMRMVFTQAHTKKEDGC